MHLFFFSLSFILKPVSNLGHRQSSFLAEFLFLLQVRILLMHKALSQGVPRPFLKTIDCFLTVPDCSWQRELSTNSVFVYSTQWSTASDLCFFVVCTKPKFLKSTVVPKNNRIKMLAISLTKIRTLFYVRDTDH